MTYIEMQKEIQGLRAMAKDYRDITDEDLANYCGLKAKTLRNKASGKKLPEISIWKIQRMAELAKKKVVFVDA